jgi:hypothetical protein
MANYMEMGDTCDSNDRVDTLLDGGKMIMVIIVEVKVIMRLPSTGAKVIKVITYMEMGDTSDRCDEYDTLWVWREGCPCFGFIIGDSFTRGQLLPENPVGRWTCRSSGARGHRPRCPHS